MKYDSELYDLPVVDRLSGEILGSMRGVVCQPGKKKMEGILFEERGWMRRCHFVPWQSVSVIGDRSIVIDGAGKSRAPRSVSCPGKDSKVYNSDGSYIGRISNYIIDEKSGSVMGMELSESLVDDLKFGRKIIGNTGNIVQGEQYLMMVGQDESGSAGPDERRSEDEGLH